MNRIIILRVKKLNNNDIIMIQCIAEGEPSITRENKVLEIRGTYKVTKKTSLFFIIL